MKKRNGKSALLGIICLVALFCLVTSCAPKDVGSGASKPVDTESGNFTWEADSDCAACHELESASFEDEKCLASTTHQSVDCVSCHTDVTTLTSIHEGATAKKAAKLKRLSDTKIDGTSCFACHVSYEALAEKTASSTVLTDTNGTVVNPHGLSSNTSHDGTQCSDCHTMHKEASLEENAQDYCISCHHGGKYECYTCHG